MRSVDYVVYGTPAPQGSKRGFVNKRTGRVNVVESSKRVGPWREAVKAATLGSVSVPFEGPLRVRLLFGLTRPKGHFGTGRNAGTLRPSAKPYPDVRPDIDKLARSTIDGLTDGGAFRDDSQIVSLTVDKTYSRLGHCQVTIREQVD